LTPPKVLAVDIDEHFLEMMREVLENKGFEVITAAKLPAALEPIVVQSFDALVTELQIPRSEDGLALVTAMRQRQPNALRIVICASPESGGAIDTIRQIVDEMLVKPFDFEHLAELIRRSKAENRLGGSRTLRSPLNGQVD
jgi:DNA-binding NtrC family response regulator